MAMGTVLDPRYKMGGVEFMYSKIFCSYKAKERVKQIREALYELFNEYVNAYNALSTDEHGDHVTSSGTSAMSANMEDDVGWHEVFNHLKSTSTQQYQKSELDIYLEEGCYIFEGNLTIFDALKWWNVNNLKFPVLSSMVRDILAVPVTSGLISSLAFIYSCLGSHSKLTTLFIH